MLKALQSAVVSAKQAAAGAKRAAKNAALATVMFTGEVIFTAKDRMRGALTESYNMKDYPVKEPWPRSPAASASDMWGSDKVCHSQDSSSSSCSTTSRTINNPMPYQGSRQQRFLSLNEHERAIYTRLGEKAYRMTELGRDAEAEAAFAEQDLALWAFTSPQASHCYGWVDLEAFTAWRASQVIQMSEQW